jgi:hypothetical protein
MYCPYCGDEDLRPHEEALNAFAGVDSDNLPPAPEHNLHRRGTWECRSCTRVFSVKFVGLLARHAAAGAGTAAASGAGAAR